LKRIERLNLSLKKAETWETFYRSWEYVIDDIGLDIHIDPLFTPIYIHIRPGDLSNIYMPRPALGWLKASDITEHRRKLQRLYSEFPSNPNVIMHRIENESSGISRTLDILYACRHDKELVVATLVCASYQTHLNNRVSDWDDLYGKSKYAMDLLHSLAQLKLIDAGIDPSYYHAHTTVLPIQLSPWKLDLESLRSVKYFLALEHAILLTAYTPVLYEFCERPGPFIKVVTDS